MNQAVTLLSSHDWHRRVTDGLTNRSSALTDKFILDKRLERVLWVCRLKPTQLLRQSYQGPSFSREVLQRTPIGTLWLITRYAGHPVRGRFLYEHAYPYSADQRLGEAINHIAEAGDCGGRVIIFSPKETPLLQFLDCEKSLFDAMDDWRLSPIMEHRKQRIEQGYIAARQADTITANTQAMVAAFDGHPDVRLLPNAASGSNGKFWESLKASRSNRDAVVIVGHYHRLRFDTDLMVNLLEAMPKTRFVFFGSLDWGEARRRVVRFENFYLMKPVHFVVLRSLLPYFGAMLVPQPVNDYTLSQDLIKVYEGLAAGLPIIAPALSPCDRLPELARPCSGEGDFIASLRDALERDTLEDRYKRVEWVQSQTWDARYNQVFEWLIS